MIDLLLELPWPPKELTPNFKRRHHWRRYREIHANYRLAAKGLTKAFLREADTTALTIHSVTFYPPDRRRRDDDGMIGAFKAGRDGIADALGVDDNTFRPAYHIAQPVRDGKIVVRLAA